MMQTVGYRVWSAGPRDSRGNVTDVWASRVDVTVYGWFITDSTEPQEPGHDRLKVDAQVLAPPEWMPKENDIVELPGLGDFSVVGITQDFNHGPFGWSPGNVVNLEKVTG